MVGISYTGVDGKTTRISAISPADAINKLNKIPGYKGNVMDSAAAGLAQGFAARHKNASRVASMQTGTANLAGASRTDVAAYKGGTASAVDAVSGLRVNDEGELVATTRKNYVGSDGSVVAVGRANETNLGKLGAITETAGSGGGESSGDEIINLSNSAVSQIANNSTVINNVSESVVNNIVNNNQHITKLINKIVNQHFVTNLFNNSSFKTALGVYLSNNIEFHSLGGSNMRFEVASSSSGGMNVGIGAYYTT